MWIFSRGTNNKWIKKVMVEVQTCCDVCRCSSRAWKLPGVSIVCCLVSWGVEPCRNHGSDILRRPELDILGGAPVRPGHPHRLSTCEFLGYSRVSHARATRTTTVALAVSVNQLHTSLSTIIYEKVIQTRNISHNVAVCGWTRLSCSQDVADQLLQLITPHYSNTVVSCSV